MPNTKTLVEEGSKIDAAKAAGASGETKGVVTQAAGGFGGINTGKAEKKLLDGLNEHDKAKTEKVLAKLTPEGKEKLFANPDLISNLSRLTQGAPVKETMDVLKKDLQEYFKENNIDPTSAEAKKTMQDFSSMAINEGHRLGIMGDKDKPFTPIVVDASDKEKTEFKVMEGHFLAGVDKEKKHEQDLNHQVAKAIKHLPDQAKINLGAVREDEKISMDKVFSKLSEYKQAPGDGGKAGELQKGQTGLPNNSTPGTVLTPGG